MSDVPHNISCWEEGAVCGSCDMVLRENETMIFSVSDSNTMAGFAILISVLGFAINSITLVAILLNNHVRRQLNTPYIISVLCTDLCFCSFILPMRASRYYNRQAEATCNLSPVLFYISLGAFILSLMLLTMVRTCILFFQEKTEKILKPWVRFLAISLCWLIPVAVMIPPMLGWYSKIGHVEYTQGCTIMQDEQGRSPETILSNLFFFFPCTVMIICNIMTFAKLKVSSSVTDRKIVIFMLGTFFVFLFFLLSLIPSLTLDYVDDCFQFPGSHTIAYILCWTGSLANPIIFLGMEKCYRDAVRVLVFKKLKLPFGSDEPDGGQIKTMRMKTFRAHKQTGSDDAISI
jgi:hypothetical protein